LRQVVLRPKFLDPCPEGHHSSLNSFS
jgi:hypothetical protein